MCVAEILVQQSTPQPSWSPLNGASRLESMGVRIIRIIAPWVLLLFFTCSWAYAQDAPPRVEVFAEGGGSFLSNGTLRVACPAICTPSGCPPCSAGSLSFSNSARLFAGARFRFTRHDAIEASYSYSPNPFVLAQQSDRLDLLSFNYVRYLRMRTRLQPFVTAGVGANHFSGLSTAAGFPPGNGYQFAWNYGGGADIVLQRCLALRLELRDYVGGQPSFITGTSHNIVPSAGVVFRLK
jgi:hypothetical protein